ncbi:HCL395Cp [Eremothecium sinecaudum]|uniref:non-specific serine/threonine protein kinase n=1 Tax=Eremothecium sinecaudum TaxID=45286 RepID=A0A120K1W0_9SACH|nr:HCL395Cp [Eremothecium sinecaudum]AMD19756.1 HCL395Cp [Eremothecium sinecaudum]
MGLIRAKRFFSVLIRVLLLVSYLNHSWAMANSDKHLGSNDDIKLRCGLGSVGDMDGIYGNEEADILNSYQSSGKSACPVLTTNSVGKLADIAYRPRYATPMMIENSGDAILDSQEANSPSRSMLTLNGNHVDISTLTLSDILIVTDIEGGLHALNRQNGQLLWSICSDNFPPLLEVSEPVKVKNETLIVEPYGDGNIYYFSTYQGLQKLPVSIKQLVNLAPMDLKTKIVVDDNGTTLEDQKIYTGSRMTAVYTLDAFTGEIFSVYGPGTENKVYKSSKVNCTRGYEGEECDNVLVLGKTVYELGIHTKENTIYNVTYAQWQPNTIDNYLASQNIKSPDGIYVGPFRDKTLLAIDSDFTIAKWVSPKFPGIVNNVFDIYMDYSTNEKILLPHPLKTTEDFDENKYEVYLDQTKNKSWFAMSSAYFPSLVETAPKSKFSSSKGWRKAQIFEDEELFKAAVTGVHTIEYFPFDKFLINDEEYSYQSFNDKQTGLLDPPKNKMPSISDPNSRSLGKYMSPKELLHYRMMLEDEASRKLNSGSNSLFSVFAKFFYRVFESGVTLMMSIFFIMLLSNFKVIPPLHILLEKSGIIPVQHVEPPSVEISSEVVRTDSSTLVEEKTSSTEQLSTKEKEHSSDANEEEAKESEKKKRRRGKRGAKTSKRRTYSSGEGVPNTKDFEFKNDLKNIAISDKILGYGSSGTIVFQGTFQHRAVAVKRMLIDFYDIASHEIKLLTESDYHENVVRYYCSEVTEKFLYIALELCTATLEDIIEAKDGSHKFYELHQKANPVNVLYQMASGIAHLHSMKIVHRDLKPQNILVAPSKQYPQNPHNANSVRILISDFGLCKKLDAEESSFKTNMNNAAGTSGWRAPELLNGRIRISDAIDNEESLTTESNSTSNVSFDSVNEKHAKQRLTRAIDIFSLGCVFYYVLTNGRHPFGDKFIREANIIKGEYSLEDMSKFIKDRSCVLEAKDLVSRMIQSDPLMRPTSHALLTHPFFWPVPKKLEFLLKVSDRFEIERRDPPSPLLLKLEEVAVDVIPEMDWMACFDQLFISNLGKYRKYHGDKLMDLLRALRNKYHHFHDLPDVLADIMGPIPDGFYTYFIKRFPNLLMAIYFVVKENLKDDQILGEFFIHKRG